MNPKAPDNRVDLGAQARQAEQQRIQQQQMWQAEQEATRQAQMAQEQQAAASALQSQQQATAQQAQFDAINAGQGSAANATGGASGIKAANTALTNSAGMSPEQIKLQAAGIASDPNSIQNLAARKSQGGLLSSSNVKLGG